MRSVSSGVVGGDILPLASEAHQIFGVKTEGEFFHVPGGRREKAILIMPRAPNCGVNTPIQLKEERGRFWLQFQILVYHSGIVTVAGTGGSW